MAGRARASKVSLLARLRTHAPGHFLSFAAGSITASQRVVPSPGATRRSPPAGDQKSDCDWWTGLRSSEVTTAEATRANHRSAGPPGWRAGPLCAPPARADDAKPAGAAARSDSLRPGRGCHWRQPACNSLGTNHAPVLSAASWRAVSCACAAATAGMTGCWPSAASAGVLPLVRRAAQASEHLISNEFQVPLHVGA